MSLRCLFAQRGQAGPKETARIFSTSSQEFDRVPPQHACDPAARLCQQLEAEAGSVGRAVYFADVAKEPIAGGPVVYVYLYIGCPGIF